ncbi:MAG: PAS domain S-box protein [Archaeoglobaceae archaeon]
MIQRLTLLLVTTSALSIALTSFVFFSNLPLSFLVYVLIVAFGIGVFALGSVFRRLAEIRELLLESGCLVQRKDELEEIKLSIENLLDKSDKLSDTLNSLRNLIRDFDCWIFEVENGIIKTSNFAERVLGFQDSEIVGKKIEDIFVNFKPNSECEAKGKNGVVSVELKSFDRFFVARNIEKRKRLEKELAWLKAVFEHSVDAIVILDLDSRIISWSKGAEMMLGYNAEEVVGKPFNILLPEELAEKCRENLKKAILEGFAKDIESVRITKNGQKILVDQTLTSIYSEGELVGFVSIMRDITKKKETETKLIEVCEELEKKTKELLTSQKELEYLARIVETSNDAIYSVDGEGKIRSWNRTAERLFGWRREEIIGKDSSLLLPDEIKNETELILRRIREGETELRFETRRLTKNGEVISVEVTISPVGESGFSVIVREISGDLEKRMFRFNVERGRTYFTKDLREAVAALKDLANFGYKPVILSRKYPEEFAINAQFYWLSEKGLNDTKEIYELLTRLEGWKNAILLDLDFLLMNKNFEEVFALIQKLKDIYFVLNKGVIIVYSSIIDIEKESLIRSECPELKAKISAIPREMFEILRVIYAKSRSGDMPSIKDVMDELRITRNTTKKRLAYLVDRGLVRVIKQGREKVLEVTEEGKALIADTF